MNGIVRVKTNEILSSLSTGSCTWIGWYFNNPQLSQGSAMLHLYYSEDKKHPVAVSWNTTLSSISNIPIVTKIEISPLSVSWDLLRSIMTQQSDKETGWDIIQEQLDEISVEMGTVFNLHDMVWETTYSTEAALTEAEDIVLQFVPFPEDIMELRHAIVQGNMRDIVQRFNSCFPRHEILYQNMYIEEEASTQDELTNLLIYYESLPPFDNNVRKVQKLKEKLRSPMSSPVNGTRSTLTSPFPSGSPFPSETSSFSSE